MPYIILYELEKTLIKISVYKGFVRFYTNTTAFKKHRKIIIIVELKKIGHCNINAGTTLRLESGNPYKVIKV